MTLLFRQEMYERAVYAYLEGLEHLAAAAAGGGPRWVASVASLFVSRIDTVVDAKLADALNATTDKVRRASTKSLAGQVATANAG